MWAKAIDGRRRWVFYANTDGVWKDVGEVTCDGIGAFTARLLGWFLDQRETPGSARKLVEREFENLGVRPAEVFE